MATVPRVNDPIAQPQVPQGLDPLTLHHWLWWQLLCADADGTAFQQLAEKVLRCVHPDFVPVRPYGKIGDRKNDGMLMESGTVFQVYSPDVITQAKAIGKIKEDLPGAIEHWLDKGLRKWVFVYNVRRGLPPDLVGHLAEKREELKVDGTDVELELLDNHRLWRMLRDLPLQDRVEILGAPIGYEHLFFATNTDSETLELLKHGRFVVVQDVMSPINTAQVVEALGAGMALGPPLHLRRGPGAEEDWVTAARVQGALVDEAMAISRDLLPRFAVFSLAPIPLAIHLGSLLSDRVEVECFQYDRFASSWCWPATADEPPALTTSEIPAGTSDAVEVAIRVGLSASVHLDDVQPHIPDAQLVDIYIATNAPDPRWLRTADQLAVLKC